MRQFTIYDITDAERSSKGLQRTHGVDGSSGNALLTTAVDACKSDTLEPPLLTNHSLFHSFASPVHRYLLDDSKTCSTGQFWIVRIDNNNSACLLVMCNGLVSVEGLLQLQVQTVRLRDLRSGGAGCLFWLQRRIERRDKRDIVGNGKVLGFRDGQSKVSLSSVAQVRDH